MANEESQAEVQPEATPVVEVTPQEPVVESQAFDYAVFTKDIAALGDGYTPETVVSKTQDLIKGMNDAQMGHASYKQRMSAMEPVVDYMNQDPKFREHMRTSAEGYFSGSKDDGYGERAETSQPSPMGNAFDPMQQRLNQVEIFRLIDQTGNGNVNAHYWELMGPKLVQSASGTAAEQTAESIAKANQSYVPNAGQSSVPAQAFDVTKMSQSDADSAMESDLEDMFRK